MTDRATIEALIKQGYAARERGDVDAIIACFRPDGRFHLVGSPQAASICGLAAGHAELRAAMGALVANFEISQRDFVAILIDGNRAAVHSRVKARHVPNDKIVTTDILDLWTFENGEIVEILEFADTALINSL
jgi:ketosteroid isomerase-like protein